MSSYLKMCSNKNTTQCKQIEDWYVVYLIIFFILTGTSCIENIGRLQTCNTCITHQLTMWIEIIETETFAYMVCDGVHTMLTFHVPTRDCSSLNGLCETAWCHLWSRGHNSVILVVWRVSFHMFVFSWCTVGHVMPWLGYNSCRIKVIFGVTTLKSYWQMMPMLRVADHVYSV